MKIVAILTLLGTVICHASNAPCASGDESCALETDEDELSLLQARVKGQGDDPQKVGTSHLTADDHDASKELGHEDGKPHPAETGQSELQTTAHDGRAKSNRALSHTQLNERLHSLLAEHFEPRNATQELLSKNPLSREQALRVVELLESNASSTSSCALRYPNQWFSPRINLCGDSFTGLNSCTESGCYVLSDFFYAASCHTVYYSNAESNANGYGMCRCMKSSHTSGDITRYLSSSGNNIYSCSSLV